MMPVIIAAAAEASLSLAVTFRVNDSDQRRLLSEPSHGRGHPGLVTTGGS